MVVEKTVLNPKDIADILHVSLRLVYRQLRNGTIPSVKCGDRYLISRISLEKWLSGENQAPANTDSKAD
jgi:excisionase family DNA binding protein